MSKVSDQFPLSEAGSGNRLAAIAERLVRVRDGQSQAAFASTIGVHKNSVGNYERGDREIGALALAGIADVGWNINWLLTGRGPERIDALQTPANTQFSATADVDLPSLQEAIEDTLTLLRQTGRNPSVEDTAYIVALLYMENIGKTPDTETPVNAVLSRLGIGQDVKTP